MIDIDKYEGHTEGPWWADEWFNDDVVQFERGYCVEQRIVNESPIVDHSGEWVCLVDNEADAQLIADAPLLLQEVKRLREVVDKQQMQYVSLETAYYNSPSEIEISRQIDSRVKHVCGEVKRVLNEDRKRLREENKDQLDVLSTLNKMIRNEESHVEMMKALEQGLDLPETWKEMIE